MQRNTIDNEWKNLDFQAEVRPKQQRLLQGICQEVCQIGDKLQANNERNLSQIDLHYKDTSQLEKQLISKKMDNMGIVTDSEMEGIKFLQSFGETTRDSESVNSQINQIQQIIGMLQNELSQADCDVTNITDVYRQEQALIDKRETLARDNDLTVLADVKTQNQELQQDIKDAESETARQNFIHQGLSAKQQQVLDNLENSSQLLEQEKATLEKQKMELQGSLQSVKKDNQDKQSKNRRLDCSIRQFNAKIESMEEYLDRLVFENMTQFELYQDTVKDNNSNMNKMRDDLGQFYNQNFEMENINESLEQRLDQLKGQRDLSIKLSRAGLVNELKSMLADAERASQKNINLQNNTELSWDDKLVIKMRELDDAMRQSSEQSITKMVQNYMQQIRDMNEQIVVVTKNKEEIESKLLQKVPDSALNNLVQEHSSLISEYEDIIREKIGIFTQMINDLRIISGGNNKFVQNETRYADKKLATEIWERDIHQKNRVDMDIQVEIQNYLTRIEQQEEKISERDMKIA